MDSSLQASLREGGSSMNDDGLAAVTPRRRQLVNHYGASLSEGGWRELSNESEPPLGGGSGEP
jgi:hypothetical protein